jgi:hypothetical protein
MAVFTLDGKEYKGVIVMALERSFQVLDGENSGRSQNGTMIRDIIGTYYNYTLELDTTEATAEQYDELYEAISAPVAYHTLVVPYGQNTLAFDAYVTSGTDNLLRMDEINKWSGISVKFIAMKPQRYPA